MTINQELKPCPFCGGADLSSEHWVVMPDDYHAARVVCADCELEGPSSLTLPEPDGCWTGDEASAIELGVKAWNRRAQAAQEAEPVAMIKWIQPDCDWKLTMLCEPAHPEGVALNLYESPQHDAELIELLREARRTFEMWKDVAPAISLCADIDAKLATLKVKP